MVAGALKKIPSSIRISVVIAVCTYLVFEAAVSVLYLTDVLERPDSVWLYEESGETVHFDPIRGYLLTQNPSRIARITRGTVEYVGVLKGNNQGFPDRDDFYPGRGADRGKRFAVFGDSYSAAQFVGENWPDYVEGLSRQSAAPLHLLNFSVDGGGLANWWSVMTRLVEREGYEIDGVIFAVIPGNLWRKFSIAEHRGSDRHMFGRVATWDPKALPRSLEEARGQLRSQAGNIVSTEEFDRAIELKWRPRSDKPLRPYFAWKVFRAVRKAASKDPAPPGAPKAWDSFEPGQEWMIEDIARALKAMNIPALVVHVPSREELVSGARESTPPLDTRLFASLIGARIVDGKEAFAGRGEEEIRGLWFPHDAHWDQAGSNAFGSYMAAVLRNWPQ